MTINTLYWSFVIFIAFAYGGLWTAGIILYAIMKDTPEGEGLTEYFLRLAVWTILSAALLAMYGGLK